MRKLSHEEIVQRQLKKKLDVRLPFCVVLDDVRSAHNVGSIFRTCDGAGVEKLWLFGITGYPPNAQIAKTALDAQDSVSWEHRKDTLRVVKDLKSRGYQIVLLEQTDESTSYDLFTPKPPICLVVGNEVEGINDDLLSMCDKAIEIEMTGIKNSLNVAVAFGIVAYAIRHKIINAPSVHRSVF